MLWFDVLLWSLTILMATVLILGATHKTPVITPLANSGAVSCVGAMQPPVFWKSSLADIHFGRAPKFRFRYQIHSSAAYVLDSLLVFDGPDEHLDLGSKLTTIRNIELPEGAVRELTTDGRLCRYMESLGPYIQSIQSVVSIGPAAALAAYVWLSAYPAPAHFFSSEPVFPRPLPNVIVYSNTVNATYTNPREWAGELQEFDAPACPGKENSFYVACMALNDERVGH